MDNQIDIIRTSTSRPEILQVTTDALNKHLKFSGQFRWILHEDVLDKNRFTNISKACKMYNVMSFNDPPVGLKESMNILLRQTKSKYVLNIEDDWRLLRDIEIDPLIEIMENNEDINQVAFHKRPIGAYKNYGSLRFKKREVERDGIPLVTNMFWTVIPSIFRKSFVVDVFDEWPWPGRISTTFNDLLRQKHDGPDREHITTEWVMKNLGTYYLGKINEGFYFQHLGYKPYEPEKWEWPLAFPKEY